VTFRRSLSHECSIVSELVDVVVVVVVVVVVTPDKHFKSESLCGSLFLSIELNLP